MPPVLLLVLLLLLLVLVLLVQGELMVATNMFAVYGKPATMSRITLAFMQDTGWYDVNWDSAGFMDWGWQSGCTFATGTCDAYITANPQQQFYCTNKDMAASTDSVCTFDGLARAGCDTPQFADGCSMRVSTEAGGWEKQEASKGLGAACSESQVLAGRNVWLQQLQL
jgi:hypothetical protein